jgi:hypothetical protein
MVASEITTLEKTTVEIIQCNFVHSYVPSEICEYVIKKKLLGPAEKSDDFEIIVINKNVIKRFCALVLCWLMKLAEPFQTHAI